MGQSIDASSNPEQTADGGRQLRSIRYPSGQGDDSAAPTNIISFCEKTTQVPITLRPCQHIRGEVGSPTSPF